MPKKNTIPFIDKKKSVSFQLVHRSQKDPLIVDESAPQRVLLQINKHNDHDEDKKSNSKAQGKASQDYGIFFDNDYDYLQNLTDTCNLEAEWGKAKKISNTSNIATKQFNDKINLPSSVFESNFEENIGLLSKAALAPKLQLNLDSDIVAALDDDFAFDDPANELEDNFIQLANQHSLEDDFRKDTVLTTSECPFSLEETKSRFTEYSISSNVMKRNNHLSILDDKFERLYADYDEHVLGPIDSEEIEGTTVMNDEALLRITNRSDTEEYQVGNIVQLMDNGMTLNKDQQSSFTVDCHTEPKKSVTLTCNKSKWDCSSILSIYSKNVNRPNFIQEKKNWPMIDIKNETDNSEYSLNHSRSLTIKSLNQSNLENVTTKPEQFQKEYDKNGLARLRSKNESPEEKKLRKQVVRDERRERRKDRKMNILAFKEEEKKQKKILLNRTKNAQGNRIL